jgi:hypothetical protein
MVAIDIKETDPALAAADAELERREAARPRRLHLGMSGAGNCPRRQWFSWLWAHPSFIAARGLKAIDDGNRGEDVIAARVQMAPEVTLMTRDPETGHQFEVTDAGGHVRGHMDGVVYHHPAAPKTAHVWECKITNERKFGAFKKLKNQEGEKATLKQWDFVYWVQAQLYMLYGGYTRHWTVVASAGCRDWDGCRTELVRDEAEYFAERLRSMVENVEELPERVSESPAAFACKWCDARDVCHEGATVERNCRTCTSSRPVDGPQWHCGKHDELLTPEKQAAGCDDYQVRQAMA